MKPRHFKPPPRGFMVGRARISPVLLPAMLPALLLAVVLAAGTAHGSPGQQDKAQRKCLVTLAKQGAKVSKAQSRVISDCLKDAGRGVFAGGKGAQACMGDDAPVD